MTRVPEPTVHLVGSYDWRADIWAWRKRRSKPSRASVLALARFRQKYKAILENDYADELAYRDRSAELYARMRRSLSFEDVWD